MNKYSYAVMLIVLTTCAQNIQGAASSKPIKRWTIEGFAPTPKRTPGSCPPSAIRAHIKNLLSMDKNHPAFASQEAFERAGFVLPSSTIDQMRPEIARECHLYTKGAQKEAPASAKDIMLLMKARLGVIDKEFNEVIEGKMQTMPRWLTWYLAEVSIQDLVEHDMIPEIDESGTLNLSAQHISDLAGIECLPSLDTIKILKLGGNTLRSIGARAFSALPNLEELWLRANLIAHIDPKAFAGHVHLRRIDLLANTIEEIVPGTFADLPNLNFIDLQGTAVTDEELAQIRAESNAEVTV